MTSIFRLSEALHNKRPLLVEAVKLLLDEQDLGVRKALSEVVSYELIVLASFFNFLILLVKYSCFLLDSDFFGGSWLWSWPLTVTWLVHLGSCLLNILYGIVLYQIRTEMSLGPPRKSLGLAAQMFLPNTRDWRFTSDFYRYETSNSLCDLIYLSKRELHIHNFRWPKWWDGILKKMVIFVVDKIGKSNTS